MTLRKQKNGPTQISCASFARAGGCRCNSTYRYDDLLAGILDNLLTFAVPAPSVSASSGEGQIAIARAELVRKRERLDEIADELMEENDEVKERAYQRFKIRVEQDAKALESLERLQGQQTAKLPRPELAQQILSARADMETSLEARMKVQSCLNQLIDVILMDPNDRSATIVMIDGNLVVKMDKYGKVIGVADSLLMLQPRTYVMSDGTIATFDPRPLGVASDMPLGEMGVARVIDQLRHGALRPTVDPSQQRWKQQPDPAVLA